MTLKDGTVKGVNLVTLVLLKMEIVLVNMTNGKMGISYIIEFISWIKYGKPLVLVNKHNIFGMSPSSL